MTREVAMQMLKYFGMIMGGAFLIGIILNLISSFFYYKIKKILDWKTRRGIIFSGILVIAMSMVMLILYVIASFYFQLAFRPMALGALFLLTFLLEIRILKVILKADFNFILLAFIFNIPYFILLVIPFIY